MVYPTHTKVVNSSETRATEVLPMIQARGCILFGQLFCSKDIEARE